MVTARITTYSRLLDLEKFEKWRISMIETIRGQIYYQLIWCQRSSIPERWQYVSRDGMRGAHPDSPQEWHDSCINELKERKKKLERKHKDRVYVLKKMQTISLNTIIEQ
jgi:hypothetical protein